MQLYPGVAAPTISATPGAAAPGTIVTTGPSDSLGWYPEPDEVQDGDRRNAGNYDSSIEPLRDSINWCAQHIVDFARGGNWATWTPSVTLGCALTLEQVLSVNAASGQVAVIVNGASGQVAVEVFSNGATAIGAVVLTGNGTAVSATGGGTGHGVVGTGGPTNGHGVVGTAGGSGGAGVKGTAFASGDVSLLGSQGPLQLDTNIPLGTSPNLGSADPGPNSMWANQILKSYGIINFDNTGAINYQNGVNFTATVVTIGSHVYVKIVFTRAMLNTDYAVSYSTLFDSTAFYVCQTMFHSGSGDNVPSPTASTFYIGMWNVTGGGQVSSFASANLWLTFMVVGDQ